MRSFVVTAVILSLLHLGQPAVAAPQVPSGPSLPSAPASAPQPSNFTAGAAKDIAQHNSRRGDHDGDHGSIVLTGRGIHKRVVIPDMDVNGNGNSTDGYDGGIKLNHKRQENENSTSTPIVSGVSSVGGTAVQGTVSNINNGLSNNIVGSGNPSFSNNNTTINARGA